MKPHDPYGPMLEELRAINDSDDDDIFFESLHKLQPYVSNLRQQYRLSPSNVDFSCQYTRAAYLMAYYPHYIEPLYCIFSQLKGRNIEKFLNRPQLRVCFIGAGPAPEALGLVTFLQENCLETKCVTGYLLDKYVHGWRLGQELTRYHLASRYWPKGKLVFRPIEFDFSSDAFLSDPFADRAIRHANLFIMQNCLNDQLENPDQACETVLRIFRQASPGAVYAICDLNFNLVRELIRNIQKSVTSEGIGKVILSVKEEFDKVVTSIALPPIIKDHLLTGANNLVPKNNTKYYSSVMQRI